MPEQTRVESSLPMERAVRSLIIVAQPQHELWQALHCEFCHIQEIRVLLDRRKGERRRALQPVVHDRRAQERRRLLRIEDDLRARRYILVRPCSGQASN